MFFDTHAHLDQEEFDADRAEVIARAREEGIEAILCPAVTAASAEVVVRLAEEYDLLAAVGIHPNYTAEADPNDWDRIVELAGHPRVVAIGETGLDTYRDYSPLELQKEYFERHIKLSKSTGLPLIIHCRETEEAMLPILRAAAPLDGVLHAFSSARAFAEECLAIGLHVSFAGNVTYSNRKNDYLREVARQIPEDRLLIETDSPYLVPQAFRGRKNRNEPAYVARTAAFLAELRGVSVEQLAAVTTANARRLFGLPERV
ncbi:MAG: TatD family hydrolase [Pirellulales bacterium]|nr:TatD family hydrolase [Pirellulales bacterium]